MPTFIAKKNPAKPRDFDEVEADTYKENGSYTEFHKDGALVKAFKTELVTAIDVK